MMTETTAIAGVRVMPTPDARSTRLAELRRAITDLKDVPGRADRRRIQAMVDELFPAQHRNSVFIAVGQGSCQQDGWGRDVLESLFPKSTCATRGKLIRGVRTYTVEATLHRDDVPLLGVGADCPTMGLAYIAAVVDLMRQVALEAEIATVN
jgi:hypothetical protein